MKNLTFSHFHQHKTAAKPLYKIPKQSQNPSKKEPQDKDDPIALPYLFQDIKCFLISSCMRDETFSIMTQSLE